jgi:tetratricopeptide (TPR) repeat protein
MNGFRQAALTNHGPHRQTRAARAPAAVLLVLGFVLAGCTSWQNLAESAEPSSHFPPPGASGTELSEPTRLTKLELDLWSSPEFHRRFTESYIAETDIEPGITPKELEKMLTVKEHIGADEMDEAARILQKEVSRGGKDTNAVFRFTLGNIYFQQDRLPDALTEFRAAVKKHPKFRRAWRNLGIVYVRTEQFAEAVRALTKVVELGGGDALTYGLLGIAYSRTESYVPAESAFRMAVLLDPTTVDWKVGLAQSFLKQRRFAQAASLSENLIAERPDIVKLWEAQANAYIGLNEPLKAAESLEVVTLMGEASADVLNLLGNIYTNEGIADLAVGYYLRALRQDPQAKADSAIRAARVLTSQRAVAEAQELAEAVETLRGDSLDEKERVALLKLRARIAVASGVGTEEHIRILEKILEIAPLDGETLLLLGQHWARAAVEAGKKADVAEAEAKRAAEAAEEAGPEEAAAKTEASEQAGAAARAAREKALNKSYRAATYFERATDLEGQKGVKADALVYHAQMLVNLGKPEEAVPLLKEAEEIRHRQNVKEYLDNIVAILKRG